MNLTAEQLIAVENNEVSICISAGAGSGKTRVLVEKLGRFLELGFALDEIMVVTFTRKAARELVQRIRQQVEDSGLSYGEQRALKEALSNSWIGTIDSICARIIRDYPLEANIDPVFDIADEITIMQLQYDAAREVVIEAIKAREPVILPYIELFGYEATISDIQTLWGIVKSQGVSVDIIQALTEDSLNQVSLELDGTVAITNLIYAEILSALPDLKSNTITYKNIEQMAINQAVWLEAISRIGSLNYSEEDWQILSKLKGFGKGNLAKAVKEPLNSLKINLEGLEAIITDINNKSLVDALFILTKRMEAKVRHVKEQQNILEYVDLIDKAITLLKDYPDILTSMQAQFKHIMVDEFQDTNYRQVELIELISGNYANKVFMVGDPKQSIYRFRGAKVGLFNEAGNKVAAHAGLIHKLSSNFRTRMSLMNFINEISEVLMQNSTELEFQALVAHRNLPNANDVEMHFITQEAESELKAEETEAICIARRIKDMVNQGEKLVYKREQGQEELKAVEYRDIAILFQKSKNMEIWTAIFREYDIPYYIVGGHGFFNTEEVNNIILGLRVLNNPSDEQALIGFLRSAMIGVTDETLWLIKQKHITIAQGLLNVEEFASEIMAPDYRTLQLAKDLLAYLGDNKARLGIEEIITKLLDTTQYEHFLSLQPQAEQKLANIKKLIMLADNYCIDAYDEIKTFLAYIDQARLSISLDEQQAAVDSETSDAVKMMTIHQAKGLEFPLVIIPHIQQSFNLTDASNKIIFADEIGLFIRTEPKGYLRLQAEAIERQKVIEEYKRLFYVAKTRACDYLMLSAAYKTKEEDEKTLITTKKDSWLNWLFNYYSVAEEPLINNIARPGIKVYQYKQSELMPLTAEELLGRSKPASDLALQDYAFNYKDGYMSNEIISATKLMDYLRCPYYAYLKYDQAIKRGIAVNDEVQIDNLDAASLGTIIHKVIEDADNLTAAIAKLEGMLANLKFAISAAEVKTMHHMLENYFNNEKIVKLSKQGKLLKEVPFLVKTKPGQFINGFIDQLYLEDAAYHIVDLKTGSDDASVHDNYNLQLNFYQLALDNILSQDNASKIILYLSSGEARAVKTQRVDFNMEKNPRPVRINHCEYCVNNYICFPVTSLEED